MRFAFTDEQDMFRDTVRELFIHMKQRQISAVLPLMDPEKAVALTELLSGREPRPQPLPEKTADQDGD